MDKLTELNWISWLNWGNELLKQNEMDAESRQEPLAGGIKQDDVTMTIRYRDDSGDTRSVVVDRDALDDTQAEIAALYGQDNLVLARQVTRAAIISYVVKVDKAS